MNLLYLEIINDVKTNVVNCNIKNKKKEISSLDLCAFWI